MGPHVACVCVCVCVCVSFGWSRAVIFQKCSTVLCFPFPVFLLKKAVSLGLIFWSVLCFWAAIFSSIRSGWYEAQRKFRDTLLYHFFSSNIPSWCLFSPPFRVSVCVCVWHINAIIIYIIYNGYNKYIMQSILWFYFLHLFNKYLLWNLLNADDTND